MRRRRAFANSSPLSGVERENGRGQGVEQQEDESNEKTMRDGGQIAIKRRAVSNTIQWSLTMIA
jgi:hypothetical protein